ncbi:Exocyst complex component EXO70B1, partial [Mucuna pruriens]
MAQDQVDSLPENEDLGFPITQLQQDNSDSNRYMREQFMNCIEELKKENGNVIDKVFKYVDEYLKDNIVDKDQILLSQLPCDDNLVVDSLLLGIIDNLGKSARVMVTSGLKEECLHVYTSCRREFVIEILFAFAWREVNDMVMKTQYSAKALWVADRILLPNERRLFERVFEGSILFEDEYPSLDGSSFWKGLTIYPSLGTTGTDEFWFKKGMDILGELFNLTYAVKDQAIVPDGRLHRITFDVLDYTEMIHRDWKTLFHVMVNKKDKFSLYGHIAMIANLLDNSLEAISKTYKNLTLGYVFIINNRSFIELRVTTRGLILVFAEDWLQNNSTKFQQNLELYQKSSWNKILNFLKLDINESEPNVVAELMKHKLYSFNEHFDEICNVQATWFVLNEQLRGQILKSIENILLPAYGNFILKLQDCLGNHANDYIKYGMFQIKDRLNNLFLVRDSTDALMTCNVQSTWFVFDEHQRKQTIRSIGNILLLAYENFCCFLFL